ncbi:membrane protein insertion efficiency factor YidD [Patescibacteria group bacterium]
MVLNKILEIISRKSLMKWGIVLSIFLFLLHIPRLIFGLVIRLYQKIFSPDHGVALKSRYPYGYCKYQPTCSEYAHQSIMKYGVIWGGFRAIWRIFRCNPWSDGGDDPA